MLRIIILAIKDIYLNNALPNNKKEQFAQTVLNSLIKGMPLNLMDDVMGEIKQEFRLLPKQKESVLYQLLNALRILNRSNCA